MSEGVTIETALLWGALLAYAGTLASAIWAMAFGRSVERVVGLGMALGLALHTLALALQWTRLGHGPFVTLSEILSSNIWSLTLVYAIVWWRIRAVRAAAPAVFAVVFVLGAWLLATGEQDGHLPPTYRTLWLYAHVGFGKLFLGAALVAVGIAAVILLRGTRLLAVKFAHLAPDGPLEELAFRFMAFAFVFETLMLIVGAIWAQDAWGRFWAWDPLETWSFLTWLTLAAFLHLRVTLTTSPRLRACAVIAVFVLAFVTFFGVPFVSTAVHKGMV